MNRKHLFLCCVAAPMLLYPATSFAQRQTAVGPGTIPLDATGMLNGVDMSNSGTTGTLTVGVIGGPEMDVDTQNKALSPGQLAISTAASSQGNIAFNSSSTVYGGIGVTQPGGPFLLNITGGETGTAVNFLGSVYATTLNVAGTGAVNFDSGSTNIAATNFAADGTISLAPNTTLIGALTTTAGADTGTLSLGGGTILDGAVGGAVGLKAINVVGGSNTAGVSASVTGAVDAYSFALGTNTLNIGGALTIANGGVINTTWPARRSTATSDRPAPPISARRCRSTSRFPRRPISRLARRSTSSRPAQGRCKAAPRQRRFGEDRGSHQPALQLCPHAPGRDHRRTGDHNDDGNTAAGRRPAAAPGAPPAPAQPFAAPLVPVLLAITPTPDLINVLAAIDNLTTAPAVINAVAQLAPPPRPSRRLS